ncbi:Thiol:disulfide interchange protein DsbD [Bremerella volcania]|uniref:Thiol:disulfide interchange protein DsbD n=1 Tax=Bremerella volcania TaxID=2527984 RepID=A0A518C7B6_9BACT|nr:thioredoxin family protein [Bremerella volcania]QDU75119.1 Thiol:disulfide interchange protein DsbD [Bremerella volcania]
MSPIIRTSAIALLLAFQTMILAEDAVRWAPDLDTAKRVAAAKNQLVLIHFYADNCPPCRRLEANVFSQASFAQAVEQNYIPIKINASDQPAIAKEFGVDRWPQDVVIAPSGQVVYRMISPQDQDRYTGILAQVSAKLNPSASPAGPGAGMIAQAANTTPVTPQQVAPSQPQGSRYSSFTSNPAPQQTAPSQPTQQVAPQQPSTSRFASMGPSPSEVMPTQAPNQSQFSSNAPPQNVAPSQPPMQQFAQQQPAAAPSSPAPQPEPQQPKFAMDGYCPVTLVEQMKWQKGDPRWGAQHQGQIYLFSSQNEQQKFLANPNQYSPVMSGIDPVAYLGNGKVVPGDRRFGLTYRGTLYLFSSEESLQTFWNDPQRYSSMVQQAMASQNMRR